MPSNEPVRFLITAGGTATALSVVKGLRLEQDVPVRAILGDSSPHFAGRWLADDWVQLPAATEPDYADHLLQIAVDLRAQLVIPLFDPEFDRLASAHGMFFEHGARLVLPAPNAIVQCRDKLATYDFFRAHSIPTPATFSAEQARALSAKHYPLVVKPRRGRGSIDVFRVTSPEELAAALDRLPDAFVQQSIEGSDVFEITIDTFSDVHARFVECCCRERQVIKAGQSYKGRTFLDVQLRDYVRRICEGLGLTGPSCIQCFHTPQGPLFFEINPRFGAASVLSFCAGLNGPYLLALEAAGRPFPPIRVRPNVQMMRYWEEVFVENEQCISVRGTCMRGTCVQGTA